MASEAKVKVCNAAEILIRGTIDRGFGANDAVKTTSTSVTYDELDRQSDSFARYCGAQGYPRQSRMLILIQDRPEFFAVYLGAMKAGLVPVALNVRLSAKDLHHIMDDSEAVLLVMDAEFTALLDAAITPRDQNIDVIISHGNAGEYARLDDVIEANDGPFTPVDMRPDEMALWMYTSGTTGSPKAAVHKISSLHHVERYLGPEFKIEPGDRIFSTSRLFFAFSLGHVFLCALRLGATTILEESWPDPETVTRIVNQYQPTLMLTVPTMYRNLLQSGVAETLPFKQVKNYISAGERLPGQIYDGWLGATGKPLIEGVGSTETLMMFVGCTPNDYRSGVSGKPFPQTEIELRGETGEVLTDPVASGVAWVKCPTNSIGYWNLPEQTDRVFQDGWYCTNDLFSRDAEGWYSHQGRADDMLKISGQWVSPAEIEDWALNHPNITDAAVVGVENSDGLVRTTMFLVPVSTDLDQTELQQDVFELLEANLSIYKCPRRFVFLSEFPQTSTGKVQRFKLQEIAARLMETDQAASS